MAERHDMAQRFYQKASVQVAIVSAIGLIILALITVAHQRSQLNSENKTLERKVVDKTAEIQRLETLLTPFRTIALGKYTGSEQETLRKFARDLETLEVKTQQLEDRPNFNQNMWEMMTGISASIFKDYHAAQDLYDLKDYQNCAKIVQLAIDAYENKESWNMEDYDLKQHKEKLSEIYSLAVKANTHIKKQDLSYKYAKKALDASPTHFTYYSIAVAAYNLQKYQEALDNINKAIDSKPTDSEPDLEIYQEIRKRSLGHLGKD